MDYIPIDSIDDIDPRKISIRDINKRYIDKNGNRYATRFNMQKRRVEIVRLARNPQEAQKVRSAIMRGKKEKLIPKTARPTSKPTQATHRAPNSPASQSSSQTPSSAIDDLDLDFEGDLEGITSSSDLTKTPASVADDNALIDSNKMLEQPFLDEVAKELERMKSRQQVVMNKFKDWRGSLFDAQVLSEVNREMDLKCWQAGEESINYFKELYGYPRSINQYLIKMEPEEKSQLEALPSDKERMNFIRRIEAARSFSKVLVNYQKFTRDLENLINKIPEADRKAMLPSKLRELDDLKTGIHLLIQNTTQKLAELKIWQKKYTKIRASS